MTKTYALFIFLIAFSITVFSKNNLQLVKIDPAILQSTSARTTTQNFRFNNVDYLIIQTINNNADYLVQQGFTIEAYLGDGYYLTSTNSNISNKINTLPYSSISYLSSESKIDNSLLSTNTAQEVSVLLTSTIDENWLANILSQHGIHINNFNSKFHSFNATLNNQQIQDLSRYPFVVFISKYYSTRNPLMYESLLMTGTNQVQEVQPYGFNLKGNGVTVGVWDEGAFGDHIDLPKSKNFVVDKTYSSFISMYHPTEVGGCIASAGNLFPSIKGIAPQSNIVYWDVAGDILQELETGKSTYNVDISNHSYNFVSTNCFQSGLYIPEAANLDKIVHEQPTLLPIVAVGNTAAANCAIATDTFSSVDIGFQGCKNAITVGWLFGNEKLVENSGRGPTEDGRLKPELVAKGFAVSALVPNDGISAVYGSSYAAPQVAGIAALLTQQYKQQFAQLPNAALLKAILFNTARDLGNAGPDYMYGFGKPDAFRAVKSISNQQYFENTVNHQSIQTHSFSSPANTHQLKVTLSWTDIEGSPLAQKSIVNNLDLKLVTPTGDTVLPWKLNPQSPKIIALHGIDNINTNEQITIDNPLEGNYTIVVKGTDVPFGPQAYAVAYLTQERKIEITHPNGGEIIDAGNNIIRWYGNGIDSLSLIEFSSDNGANWQTVVNNKMLSAKTHTWNVPATPSTQCLIRITSGNNVDVSAANFTIGAQLNYNLITAAPCDQSVRISWAAFPGASAYRVYIFKDTAWSLVGETAQTSLNVTNLINGKKYAYAVSTIYNGFEGNHSLAKFFKPTATACLTANDVGVYQVDKPKGGRLLTSTALSNAEKISLIIKNFGTTTQNAINVSYRINGGAIRNATLTDVITSNDTSIIKFNVNENLSAIGNYNLVAWTNLIGDENTANDTLYYTIKQLQNAPIVLPFSESFESTNVQYSKPVFGINGIEYTDYYPELGAMLRANEGNLYAHTGEHAITLDNYLGAGLKKNEFIFTVNLSNYVDSIIFLSFNYLNRAEADSNDILYARGNDTQAWIPIFDLFANRGNAGEYKKVDEINLYQKLKIENGQNFSTSTQLKIQQIGTKTAITPYADGGYTFDDFLLQVAGKDVALSHADIKKANCKKSFSAQPVSVTIKNNSAATITNLPVFYQAEGQAVVSEIISTSIAANDTLQYTFNTLFNTSTAGLFPIKVWANNNGDKYPSNDSATTSVVVMETIDNFPYYNDFENNSGPFLSEGTNNSWLWTTPNKYNISYAAQDNKAWTTGASNGYNFNENSYLYLGCLDFSSLSIDPYIAFNFISVMHTQSDSAYVEYSTDGNVWSRLGCYNCGVNWYNGFSGKPYWDRVVFPWQVAHIKVPLADLQDASNFMYRLHLLSDDYIVSEGIGIDDIRIFNDYTDIATTDSTYIIAPSSANGWLSFYRNGRLVAELFDDNKNLGNVSLGYEANMDKHKTLDNKNAFPRNWVVKPQNAQIGNYKLRLYVLNTEYTEFTINEDSISRMGDIGLLRYFGLNTNLDIIDNHVRAYYKYLSPSQIQFYPYQNGYYVEFETDTLGEFYLMSTKQDADAIQNINLLDFSANKINDDVLLEWKTSREVNSRDFIIQYSFDASVFIDVDTIPAGGFSNILTPYNYLHELNASSGVFYYRIKMIDNANKISYSLIDSVYFAPTVGVKNHEYLANAYVAENDIVVELKNKTQLPAQVHIYNTNGQLQFAKKMTLSNGKNELGIANFASWSNGIYFLQIRNEKQNYYTKLLIQH
ncbi:MAG TPA: S8 family serine peptidase [Chitinophagales bacterium]|nr:S8 family serine peptidase [Chitinophagales bacterium]